MTERPTETLRVSRVVPATRERVFRAWTEPEQVKRWWTIGEGWSTQSAEIDLRVGGKFALGNRAEGGQVVLITGEFLVVEPPDRLVYTWRFPGSEPAENKVTVEFRDNGGKTEVVVVHEQASKEMAEGAVAGWTAALRSLASALGAET